MQKKRKRHYINNKELYEHLVVYRSKYLDAMSKGEQKPPLTNYIGECIMLIANRLATKRNFSKYSYVEEMIDDAIENCVKCIHNFDPEKSKLPFAYLTKVSKNAFIRRIEAEKDEQYRALANSQRYLIEDQLNPNQVMGASVELYDNLLDFMSEYEAAKARKAARQNLKKKDNRTLNEKDGEFWVT